MTGHDDSGWQLKASRQNRFIFNSTFLFIKFCSVVAEQAFFACCLSDWITLCIYSFMKGMSHSLCRAVTKKSQTKSTGHSSLLLLIFSYYVSKYNTLVKTTEKQRVTHTNTLLHYMAIIINDDDKGLCIIFETGKGGIDDARSWIHKNIHVCMHSNMIVYSHMSKRNTPNFIKENVFFQRQLQSAQFIGGESK